MVKVLYKMQYDLRCFNGLTEWFAFCHMPLEVMEKWNSSSESWNKFR